MPLRSRPPDLGVREVQDRGSHDDAVEVPRKALRRHETLSSAGRAALPVRVVRGPAVVQLHQFPGGLDRQMHSAKAVVDLLLAVVEREGSQRLGLPVMTGVGADRNEPSRCHAVAAPPARRRVRGRARVAAVPVHEDPAVPGIRQDDPEDDFRRQDADHPAPGRRLAVRIEVCGGQDRIVVRRALRQCPAVHGGPDSLSGGSRSTDQDQRRNESRPDPGGGTGTVLDHGRSLRGGSSCAMRKRTVRSRCEPTM